MLLQERLSAAENPGIQLLVLMNIFRVDQVCNDSVQTHFVILRKTFVIFSFVFGSNSPKNGDRRYS